MPETETADFRTLLSRLTESEVKFIVVGGMAMVSHGSAYVTADLDICYERSDGNLKALRRLGRWYLPGTRLSREGWYGWIATAMSSSSRRHRETISTVPSFLTRRRAFGFCRSP